MNRSNLIRVAITFVAVTVAVPAFADDSSWLSNREQQFMNKLLREHLEQAINTLPDVFRVVIVLAELEGFTYHEIADMLQLPLGTVRSRLSRGRALLQKALWRDAKEAGLAGSGKGAEE